MGLDIKTAVQTAFLLALFGILLSSLIGIRAIRAGQKLQFFRKRRDLMVRGWRLIFMSFGLGVVALTLNRYAEPAIYKVFPPSPTVTQTPTITMTPTITLTATVTMTPTITNTPSVTNTPFMPPEIASKFESSVTPNPDSVFSPVSFALEIKDNMPVEPATEFANPIQSLFGTFTYDKMKSGSQWSALWYRGTELICYETMPWDGSTGGYGTTRCNAPQGGWQPGQYEVQIYVGMDWISSGQFIVTGKAPTLRPTETNTPTRTPTVTVGPSPTHTPRPPTLTPIPTWTLPPTLTPTITNTPRATQTRWPTLTPLPTITPFPTLKPKP